MTTYGTERETANDQRLRKARELAPEIEWSDLATRGRYLVDRGSGFLYEAVCGDPLVSSYARPEAFAEIALFARDPAGSIVLLTRPERQEIGQHSEASLHQVRIEVGEEDLPADEHELDEFRGCLLEASERWARQCIADRHVEVEGV